MSKRLLKRNATLLNERKTSHRELNCQRDGALAELETYGPDDKHGKEWLARVEEAIQRRAKGHILWLLRLVKQCLDDQKEMADNKQAVENLGKLASKYLNRALELFPHLGVDDVSEVKDAFPQFLAAGGTGPLNDRINSTANQRAMFTPSAMWP